MNPGLFEGWEGKEEYAVASAERYRDRETISQVYRLTGGKAGRQAGRQERRRKAGRQAGRQTYRQTDKCYERTKYIQ